MAAERYDYPATGFPTASFIPSSNPQEDAPIYSRDDGIIGDQSAGSQIYLYEEGIKFKIHRRHFTMMTSTDDSNYESFRSTVAGDTFKFTDFAGATHTVTFVPGPREKTIHGATFYEWTDLLREEL